MIPIKKYLIILVSSFVLIALMNCAYGLDKNSIKQSSDLISLDDMSIQDKIDIINQQISQMNLSWVAGETSMLSLSEEERAAMLSSIPPQPEQGKKGVAKFASKGAGAYPSVLDWRNNGGNWVSPVKDQGSGGTCWAFSGIGVLESRTKIDLNKSTYSVDLSEQDAVSCNTDGYTYSSGGWPQAAFNLSKNTGIVKDSCFSYVEAAVACSSKCTGWQNQTLKINDYELISPASTSNIKQAVNDYGPVTVYMAVCNDFFSYVSGIYTYSRIGGCDWYDNWHSIFIVGYNDTGQYWICKNSWDTTWGESGFFKISYS
ncbi:MAG: C1 family peptidase, partial [archaeon]